jgi:GAF domain-containing protein
MFRTHRPERIDDYRDGRGAVAELIRKIGIRSAVGVPVGVESQLWGAISVASTRAEPLPADSEVRLAEFTELVSPAIANAQAALRRVATLVAQAASPREVFAAVTAEAGRLLEVDFTVLGRHEPDGALIVLGAWARTERPWPHYRPPAPRDPPAQFSPAPSGQTGAISAESVSRSLRRARW